VKPAEIRALDRLLDRIDYYRLLRVDRAASATDIRTGYHRMRRELHPDRYLAEDPAVQEALDRIARRLNEAYVVLRDGTRRTAYDRGLAEGRLRYEEELVEKVQAERSAAAGTTPNGKRFYKLMEEEEKRGDLQRALSNLKMALTFEPQNEGFRTKIAELEARVGEERKTKPTGPTYTIR
jgi:DnaJ-class molecular chaperone